MNRYVSAFIHQLGSVASTEEIFQATDQAFQKNLESSFAVCVKVSPEDFEFLPARFIDKTLLSHVETYINQGIFAEAFMAGKPFYIFDTNRYELNQDEGLLLLPLLIQGANYGLVAIVMKREMCKNLLNESQDEITEFCAVLTKFCEMHRSHETVRQQGAAVRSSWTTIHDIIESVIHGVIVVNRDNEIEFFNKNAEFLFGVEAKKVIGHAYREVFNDRLVRSLDLLMQNTLIEGHILDFEVEVALSPELKIPVGMTTSLIISGDGTQKGVIFICRDMSLTKEVNRLKELDKMKSEFVSTVSHELKNPIAVMKSSLETVLLAKQMGKDLGPEFELNAMKTVNEEIDRLTELINDLLSLARIESGKVELNRQPTDVEALLNATVKLFDVSKKTHPVTLEADLKGKVLLDSEKIKQVVINFINNAIKYSPNGCDIILKAEHTENRLRISVRDYGIGIPETEVPKVFQKFFRVHTPETASIGGTGLGLAICRKIIELHHGKIWLESKYHEGSTFGFDLPITSLQAVKTKPE